MLNSVALEKLWEQGAGPVAVYDLKGHFLDVNPAMCQLLGYSRRDLLSMSKEDITHPADPPVDLGVVKLVGERMDSYSAERPLLHADGRVLWVLIYSTLIKGPDGLPLLVAAQFHDVTAQHLSEIVWRQTMINAPIGIALVDLEGSFTDVNDRLCEQVGYSREDLAGRCHADLVYHDDQNGVRLMQDQLLDDRINSCKLTIRLRHRDGHSFWTMANIGMVRQPDTRPVCMVIQYESVGDYAQVGEDRLTELARMALYDPLTGLANRALLVDRYEQHLTELAARGGLLVALLIDLDKFKEINDRHGHLIGDHLLQAAAQALRHAVRTGDTVARLGGDEFIVLAHTNDHTQAQRLHARVTQQLNTETGAPDQPTTLSASVGMATTQDPSTTRHDLLARADRDMYTRKHDPADRP